MIPLSIPKNKYHVDCLLSFILGTSSNITAFLSSVNYLLWHFYPFFAGIHLPAFGFLAPYLFLAYPAALIPMDTQKTTTVTTPAIKSAEERELIMAEKPTPSSKYLIE